MTFSQDKPPTFPDRSSLRSLVASPWRHRVRSLIFLGLATALHSLVFVVPWPETEQVEEPEPEVLLEPEPPAISVSQLPPGSPELASKVAETAEKTTLPNQAVRQPQQQTPASRPEPTPSKPEAEIPETSETETPETETPETLSPADHPPEGGSSEFSVGDLITGSPTYVQDVSDESLLSANPENGRELWALQNDFAKTAADSQSVSEYEVAQSLNPTSLPLQICNSELDPNFSPKKVLVGIMLDPANTDVRYGPRIMASSGSHELDNLAKQEVEAGFYELIRNDLVQDPPEWHKAYFFLVEFETEPSECPS